MRDGRCESEMKVEVKKGGLMKTKSVFFAIVIVLALTMPSLAQEDKLGKVSGCATNLWVGIDLPSFLAYYLNAV